MGVVCLKVRPMLSESWLILTIIHIGKSTDHNNSCTVVGRPHCTKRKESHEGAVEEDMGQSLSKLWYRNVVLKDFKPLPDLACDIGAGRANTVFVALHATLGLPSSPTAGADSIPAGINRSSTVNTVGTPASATAATSTTSAVTTISTNKHHHILSPLSSLSRRRRHHYHHHRQKELKYDTGHSSRHRTGSDQTAK